MVGILLITHAPLGRAFVEAVTHVYKDPPEKLEALDVLADQDPGEVRRLASEAILRLNDGSGVLVLTDMIGATPANCTQSLCVPGEVEVAGDFPGEDPGFGGGDVELPALAAEGFQQGHDAVKYAVFVEAGDFEAFAIEVHRFPGFRFVEVIELHEGLQQRRADEVFEAGEVGFVDAQFAQGELDRTGDAFPWVGEGAVEVEEQSIEHGAVPVAEAVKRIAGHPIRGTLAYARLSLQQLSRN